MSSRNKIKWRTEDVTQLKKIVKNFNAKVTRQTQKGFGVYQPEKIKLRELKQLITSRSDYNKVVRKYSGYLKPGAEKIFTTPKGVKTTEWERKEVGYEVRRINRLRKEELEKAAPSVEKGTFTTIERHALNPKKYNIQNMTQGDWVRYKRLSEKQSFEVYYISRMGQYRKNYITGINNHLSGAKDNNILKKLVSNMDLNTLYYAYYDDPVLQVNYTSDPLKSDDIVNNALNRWMYYLGFVKDGIFQLDKYTELVSLVGAKNASKLRMRFRDKSKSK